MSLIYDPYDENSNIAARAGGTTALGTLLLDNHFNKELPRLKRFGRAGAVGLGTYGVLSMINNKLNRAYRTKLEERERSQMTKSASTNWFHGTELMDFVKTAADSMGPVVYSIPTKIAHDALTLYSMLPKENKASTAYELYKVAAPGFNKIAMKMVAANVVADAKKEKLAGVLSTAGSVAGKAFEPVMAGMEGASKFKERQKRDKNFYTQGASSK
jgi:hypothetical protein